MVTQRIANEICGIVETKNAIMLPQSPSTNKGNQKPSIEPPTPDSKRENGEQANKLLCPPVLISSPPSDLCSDSNLSSGYLSPSELTPKESVFDPFSPGPDKFMLAPLCRKYTEESGPSTVRQLCFSLATNWIRDISHKSGLETNTDENDMFESLYYSILDAIILEQSKECVDGVPAEVSNSDGFKTPKSVSHLSWISETCPGAPMKSFRKYRNIDKELCRKLEF